MAGYHIIHIENKWIICFEQTRLISFARKWQALKIMHTAARLIEAPNLRRAKCATRRNVPSVINDLKNVWSNRGRSG